MEPEVTTVLMDVRRWVQSRPDLHGLALIGSHAAGKARADSDIDLMIPADVPDAYRDGGWVPSALDRRIIAGTQERWFGNVWSLFVRLADGPQIEFSFSQRSWMKADPPAPEVCRIVREGIVILYDAHGELLALYRGCGVKPGSLA